MSHIQLVATISDSEDNRIFPSLQKVLLGTYACCCCVVTKSCPPLLRPHGLSPARLFCPWDFPGKNTGVGCHFLLQLSGLRERERDKIVTHKVGKLSDIK